MKLYNEDTSQSHIHIYIYIHVNHLMGMSNHISSYIPMIMKRRTMISNNAIQWTLLSLLDATDCFSSTELPRHAWALRTSFSSGTILLFPATKQTWTIVSKLCPKLKRPT